MRKQMLDAKQMDQDPDTDFRNVSFHIRYVFIAHTWVSMEISSWSCILRAKDIFFNILPRGSGPADPHLNPQWSK